MPASFCSFVPAPYSVPMASELETRQPRHLLHQHGFRAGRRSLARSRHAGAAASQDHHVVVHRLVRLGRRSLLRCAAEQAAQRQCGQATGHRLGELAARQRHGSPRRLGGGASRLDSRHH